MQLRNPQTRIRFVCRDLVPSDRAICTIASRMNLKFFDPPSLKSEIERSTSYATNVIKFAKHFKMIDNALQSLLPLPPFFIWLWMDWMTVNTMAYRWFSDFCGKRSQFKIYHCDFKSPRISYNNLTLVAITETLSEAKLTATTSWFCTRIPAMESQVRKCLWVQDVVIASNYQHRSILDNTGYR